MPNICVFIQSLLSGGAEKQAVLLAETLSGSNDVLLVVWKGNCTEDKFIDYIEKNNIRTIYLRGNIINRLIKLVFLFIHEKIDIVFSFLASNNLYGSIAGKLSGVKFIIGGIRNNEIPFLKFIIQRFLHNYILDYTIFNNYSGYANLKKKGFKGKKCFVIPNCFELNTLPISRLDKGRINVISVARFIAQKDYQTAIKAITYLATHLIGKSNIQIRYTIIGYGILENQIRSQVSQSGLDEIATIIINPPNLPLYLKQADIFLTTSLFEGTSNSILEAMSYSLPIVATDAGDNNKLVLNDQNGYLTPKKDYVLLAENLLKLCESITLRNQFGLYSYNHLRDNYSVTAFQKKYLTFINETLKCQKSG
jgi:glycosyltransferase involved in cell wall biosynthesis